jgi:hypothetical protein
MLLPNMRREGRRELARCVAFTLCRPRKARHEDGDTGAGRNAADVREPGSGSLEQIVEAREKALGASLQRMPGPFRAECGRTENGDGDVLTGVGDHRFLFIPGILDHGVRCLEREPFEGNTRAHCGRGDLAQKCKETRMLRIGLPEQRRSHDLHGSLRSKKRFELHVPVRGWSLPGRMLRSECDSAQTDDCGALLCGTRCSMARRFAVRRDHERHLRPTAELVSHLLRIACPLFVP